MSCILCQHFSHTDLSQYHTFPAQVLFTSFGSKADMGATWSSVAMQFEELLQYKDNNYDGKYTASVDTPVKRIKFANAFTWKKQGELKFHLGTVLRGLTSFSGLHLQFHL